MEVDEIFVKSDIIIDIFLSKKRTNLQVPIDKAIDGFLLFFCQFGYRNPHNVDSFFQIIF